MKPVLIDTSVWRRFFAGSSAHRTLSDLLQEDDVVVVHPFVIGELVMGGLSEREKELFERLPALPPVAHQEVLRFVARRRLTRRGLGWIDAHLLASALASSALLWSGDKVLAAAAADLAIAYQGTKD